MDARKEVKQDVPNWYWDDNQEQQPGPLENNEDLIIDVTKEDVENCDWDYANHPDREPGECEKNDGPMDLKEEVENCDPNHQEQQPGSRERNDDGLVRVKPGSNYKERVRQKEALDPRQFPEVIERERLTSSSSKSSGEKSLDLFNDPWVRLTVKCFLPRNYFGKLNLAPRIFGPKGSYLRALKDETGTAMFFRGKGSMKDPAEEQLLRDGGDPDYSHLHEEAHVAIMASAPASKAYSKLGYATSCLKRHVLWRDGDAMPPWIARVIKKGEGPSRYYTSKSSKDGCSRYTRDRDPISPRGVNLTEQRSGFGNSKNTVNVVDSAGSKYRRLRPTASQEYRSGTSVRYHPYR